MNELATKIGQRFPHTHYLQSHSIHSISV